MFTGLVTDIGYITAIQDISGGRRFQVQSNYEYNSIDIGASILHSGVCLTITRSQPSEKGVIWSVDAVPETLKRTVLGHWQIDDGINLEKSLRLGDEVGGHFVFGHVDGVGEIIRIEEEGQSSRMTIRPPVALEKYMAEKGSVSIDGISLTIATSLADGCFQICAIPHTLAYTTLQFFTVGRKVNLEIDMLARYVDRLTRHNSQTC